ncbi:MAG: ATP-binding protein, partial [bacterium]|nr:ATP-binding protein [bacterium]
LALKSRIDPNLEWRGDWVLLSQTLRYIIDNAIKFSHAKGEINIIATHENSDLVISISDQGPGINPARLTEIFDEFAVKNVMSHSKGIAVSMAIAKLVLEHHNGSITVKSEPGKGATFVLKIPEINS